MEYENPMGTDGFEFVEFTAPDPQALGSVFEKLGFALVGRHRSKNVTQYRQGDINFHLASDQYGYVEVGHLAICHAILDFACGLDVPKD